MNFTAYLKQIRRDMPRIVLVGVLPAYLGQLLLKHNFSIISSACIVAFASTVMALIYASYNRRYYVKKIEHPTAYAAFMEKLTETKPVTIYTFTKTNLRQHKGI